MPRERKSRLEVRISEHELVALESKAAELGMTKSDYVRTLVRLPLEVGPGPDGTPGAVRVIVADRATMRGLRRELRAWGYHYNQAVRALNTIQARRNIPTDEARALYRRAVEKLEGVEAARADLSARVAAVERSAVALVDGIRREGGGDADAQVD